MKTDYEGIDYGMGATNIDNSGIRYGVINQSHVLQAWADESEPFYGVAYCSECDNKISIDMDRCPKCLKDIEDEFDYAEPIGFFYEGDGYIAESDSYGDIFIAKSPYYTYAQFCSPCAPGACYLGNPLETPDENNKCYCFGHDWFEDGVAPYDVYDITTGEIITRP